ncbi:lysozyme inhibitor LprI family protein [Pseudomonas kulmbachensis]|uniref:lysozyme inhibitor LprI family protein n=1 Tax=Pseudomonas kulmbachensis TaxID=3043408 RepID=UPI002AB3247D|nr:lysozyme inhibitor LprI family protein [Pseudomonas sp. FLM 004-28]
MRKIISVVVVATSFATGAAFAQVPAKPDVNPVTNGAVNMASTPTTTTAKTAVTSDAGALKECYDAIGDDQPRTALQPCLERKTREVTSQMNIAYKKLEAQTKEIDSSATPKALASLLASQRTFEKFKDAQCQWEADSAMGGTGAGDFLRSCEVDLMRFRTKQLSD